MIFLEKPFYIVEYVLFLFRLKLNYEGNQINYYYVP